MNCDDLSSPYQNLEKPCSLQLHFVGFVVPASRLHRLEIILHQLYSTGDWLTNCFMLLVFGLYHYMLCTSFPWVFILIYLFTILRLLRVDLCCFILLKFGVLLVIYVVVGFSLTIFSFTHIRSGLLCLWKCLWDGMTSEVLMPIESCFGILILVPIIEGWK